MDNELLKIYLKKKNIINLNFIIYSYGIGFVTCYTMLQSFKYSNTNETLLGSVIIFIFFIALCLFKLLDIRIDKNFNNNQKILNENEN